MRECTGCKQTKPLSEYQKCAKSKDGHRRRCKECRKSEYSPEKKRVWKLQSYYGITVEQYDEILESQDGVCAICKNLSLVELDYLLTMTTKTELSEGCCVKTATLLLDTPWTIQKHSGTPPLTWKGQSRR